VFGCFRDGAGPVSDVAYRLTVWRADLSEGARAAYRVTLILRTGLPSVEHGFVAQRADIGACQVSLPIQIIQFRISRTIQKIGCLPSVTFMAALHFSREP
jgi:hypothetical protein